MTCFVSHQPLVFKKTSTSIGFNSICSCQQQSHSSSSNTNTNSSYNSNKSVSRRSILQNTGLAALSSLISSTCQVPDFLTAGTGINSQALADDYHVDYVFDVKSGSFLPQTKLTSVLERDAGNKFDRCIIAGETHQNKRTHEAQLAIIDGARKMNDKKQLIVGLEQFYRHHNDYLNEYRLGNTSLDELIIKTDWDHTWGFNINLYKPIFQYCQYYHIPMYGLNIPSPIIKHVSQFGIQHLPSDVFHNYIPQNMDFNNRNHFEHFQNLMMASGHFSSQSELANLSSEDQERITKQIEKYYEVQVLWEEYMSQSASNLLTEFPNTRLVTLIGSGHVESRFGFPDRLQKRTNERPYTIVPKPVSWVTDNGYNMPDISKPERDIADLVWYTREA